ncbi:hypothetical protein [Streptomyces sp. AM6-12]
MNSESASGLDVLLPNARRRAGLTRDRLAGPAAEELPREPVRKVAGA